MEKYPCIAKFSLVEDVGFDNDTIMCQEDGGYSSPRALFGQTNKRNAKNVSST